MKIDWDNPFYFVGAIVLTSILIFGVCIGGITSISRYSNKIACESFAKQNPKTETFYSFSTGCLYKREDSTFWWSLK